MLEFIIVDISNNVPVPAILTEISPGFAIFKTEAECSLVVNDRAAIVLAVTFVLVVEDVSLKDEISILVNTIRELAHGCGINLILITSQRCDEYVLQAGIIVLPTDKAEDPFAVVGALSAKFNSSHTAVGLACGIGNVVAATLLKGLHAKAQDIEGDVEREDVTGPAGVPVRALDGDEAGPSAILVVGHLVTCGHDFLKEFHTAAD